MDEILGADRQRIGLLFAVFQTGQKNDRDVARHRAAFQPVAQRVAIRHRHDDVEKHEVGPVAGLEVIDHGLPATKGDDVVGLAEKVLDDQEIVRLVVDGDDSLFHGVRASGALMVSH